MPEPLARDKLYSLKYFNLLAKAPPAKCRDVPGKKGGWQTAKGGSEMVAFAGVRVPRLNVTLN